MKKKVAALLLSATLLIAVFSGCLPLNAQKEPSDPASADTLSGTPPEVTPEKPGSSQTGKPVNTPGSTGLEPFSLDETYTRRYAENVYMLRPAKDYGKIYPYAGGISGGRWMSDQYIFGLCTEKGEIICDPAYTEFSIFEYDGRQIYSFKRTFDQTLPFDYETVNQNIRYDLTLPDGSKLATFEAVQESGEGMLTVKENGKWGCVDFDLKQLIPCEYGYPIYFSEGLAAVSEDITKNYRYIDRQNRTVLFIPTGIAMEYIDRRIMWDLEDTYAALFRSLSFHDGRAAFFEQSNYGYIDTEGRIAVPANYYNAYSWPYSFDGDYIVVTAAEDMSGIIDRDGNVTYPITRRSFWQVAPNLFSTYNSALATDEFIDAHGTVLLQPEKGTYINCYDGIAEYTIHSRESGIVTTFIKNGKRVVLGNCMWLEKINENRYIACINKEETSIYRLIDAAGNILYETEGESYLSKQWSVKNPTELIWSTPSKSGFNIYGSDAGRIDLDGNVILEPIHQLAENFNDCYIVRQGMYGGLKNKNGEWIIKVSLLDSMPD